MKNALQPMHFMDGTKYPLKAAFFTIRHPSLWPLCITPILINILVVILFWIWSGHYTETWFDGLASRSGWWWEWLSRSAHVLVFVLRILATFFAFVIVGNIAAVPFNDFLSERVDALVLGWKDTRPFNIWAKAREILITVLQEAKRLFIYLVIIITLFAFSFIPVLTPFTTLIQLLVTAVFFSMDYLSYPLERRGALLLKQKYGFARRHMSSSLGFGATMTLIGFIPLINFLFFPLGVVGGTLMFAEIYKRDDGALRITHR